MKPATVIGVSALVLVAGVVFFAAARPGSRLIPRTRRSQQQKIYFGPQVQVGDYKNCADLVRPNVPRVGIVVPPTIAPLLPMLQWLHEPL